MINSDIVLLVPIAWGLIWGGYKGLISQITSLIGMVIVFYFSIQYYTVIGKLISEHIHTHMAPFSISVISFLLLFVLLLAVVYFISKQFEKMAKTMQIGFINHIAGALFGLMKWIFIESFLISLSNKFDQEIHLTLVDFHHTWIYNHIEMIAPFMMNLFEKST